MGLFGKSRYEKGNIAFLKNDYTTAKKIWEEGVEKGESDCMLAIGSMYEKGKGVEIDLSRAFSYYDMAARKKNKFGYYYVGRCYLYGIGVTPDEAKGREYLKTAFSKGVALAKKEIANYEADRKAIQNRASSNTAANSKSLPDNGVAEYEKAKAYVSGTGTPVDISKAIQWLQAAVDKGHVDAMKELADCYLHGAGVNKDEKKAFEIYRKAADMGDINALYIIAAFYLNGVYVSKDFTEGLKWLRKAADKGDRDALTMLGTMYHTGQGVNPDTEEAFRLLSAAASLRDSRAELMVGHFYYYGIGTEQNYDRAFSNLLAAYDDGEKKASLLLGFYYLNHSGHKTKDYEKAFRYLREAMSLGLPDAESNVAYCYAKGLGVARDQAEAMRIFRRIYENESKDKDERASAACNIGIILLANHEVKRDVTGAMKYLREAQSLGSALATYYLGMLYYDGASQDGHTVLAKDLNAAYRLLREAAIAGIPEARKYLTSDLSAIIPRSTLKAQGILGDFLSELAGGMIDSIGSAIVP